MQGKKTSITKGRQNELLEKKRNIYFLNELKITT